MTTLEIVPTGILVALVWSFLGADQRMKQKLIVSIGAIFLSLTVLVANKAPTTVKCISAICLVAFTIILIYATRKIFYGRENSRLG
jgi:hypothetical protein